MAQWFAKMMGGVGGKSQRRQPVRDALAAAYRARLKIALELQGPEHPVVMATLIEQVGEDDLVISQPSIGGLTHPLAFGESMKISFVLNNNHHIAYTKCLGRVKIPSGGGGKADQTLFAYRLAMPEALKVEERRANPRVQLGFDIAPEAQLYAPVLGAPVLGTLTDISMTGAQVRSSLAVGRLAAGQEVFLKVALPEPIGLVDELVDVARVTVDPRTGHHVIGVAFRRAVYGLSSLMRSAQTPAAAPGAAVAQRRKSA